jgi:hypothetical protein
MVVVISAFVISTIAATCITNPDPINQIVVFGLSFVLSIVAALLFLRLIPAGSWQTWKWVFSLWIIMTLIASFVCVLPLIIRGLTKSL